MNWYRTTALVAVMVAGALPAFAQQQGLPRPERGVSVETALRLREELKLSGAQVSQLESLRKEIVAQRQHAAREMIDLRSRAAAGSIDRAEARKQVHSRREAMREAMQQRQQRLHGILSEEQREQLAQRRRRPVGERRAPGFGPPPRDRWRW